MMMRWRYPRHIECVRMWGWWSKWTSGALMSFFSLSMSSFFFHSHPLATVDAVFVTAHNSLILFVVFSNFITNQLFSLSPSMTIWTNSFLCLCSLFSPLQFCTNSIFPTLIDFFSLLLCFLYFIAALFSVVAVANSAITDTTSDHSRWIEDRRCRVLTWVPVGVECGDTKVHQVWGVNFFIYCAFVNCQAVMKLTN